MNVSRKIASLRGSRGRGMPRNCVSIARRCVGAFARRAGALLCAVLLLVYLALSPLRARAAGVGALAAVAGVTVLGAYLMASGVYPYMTEAGQSLSEWTSDNLQPLLDKYNAYLTSIGKSYQITLQGATPTIKGYLTQGVVMIANDVWGKLREFVTWLQSEYGLPDNASGVVLGGQVAGHISLPYYTTNPTALQLSTNGVVGMQVHRIIDTGNPSSDTTTDVYFGTVNYGNARVASYLDESFAVVVAVVPLDYAGYQSIGTVGHLIAYAFSNDNLVQYTDGNKGSKSINNQTYYYLYSTYRSGWYYGRDNAIAHNSTRYDNNFVQPLYDSFDEAIGGLLGASQSPLAGVTVDTTIVAPLAALPDGTPWGGLAIEGTGAAASPAVVNDTIGGAIAEREKPVVRPVEIEVQAGTDVDEETGEITTDEPITVTPDDVPLITSDYALPVSITTVFPFSLPWDYVRVLQALNAEPEPISFTVQFPHIGLTDGTGLTDEDFTFQIVFPPSDIAQNEDFIAFMAWFRNVELIVMCVAATWGLVSFVRRG